MPVVQCPKCLTESLVLGRADFSERRCPNCGAKTQDEQTQSPRGSLSGAPAADRSPGWFARFRH